ncbi:MAG: hypothetical protein ACTH5W_18805 [Providencia sp.]|uniref:hypothetical protein n=1 Tax=Providencia sp. TaxID=589 RepID=UPI003F95041A
MRNLLNIKHRLVKIVESIPDAKAPLGWELCSIIAIGGLTEVGFSKQYSNMLLVISSAGRGLIDCNTGEKIARDYEEYGDWYSSFNLTSMGIGIISNESISISGLCGGGLPVANHYGETLTVASPKWPLEYLIWAPLGKEPLIDRFQEGCLRIMSDFFVCAGFSWNGEFIVAATSSDITIWKRV